jgi:hypothetical protein
VDSRMRDRTGLARPWSCPWLDSSERPPSATERRRPWPNLPREGGGVKHGDGYPRRPLLK